MKRKVPAMERSMNGLLRMAQVAVVALMVGTAGQASRAEAASPLLHNSTNTGSTKWAANGGWGVAGTKYGEIACTTCHDRNSTNVKRLRTSIATPDGTNWAGPSAPSVAVSFLDARNGTSQFGDDTGGHATSNRICEVCHSQTSYHRYNTAGLSVLTHYNKTDCTSCHKHNMGFKASCSACHGGGSTGTVSANFWPDGSNANAENTAGRHARHMEILANRVYGLSLTNLLNDPASPTKQRELCSYCHDTPGDDGDHATAGQAEVNDFYTLWSKGVDNGSYVAADDGGNGTCATTDCHNGKTTPAGYSWYGATASACIMCHSDVTAETTHNAHTGAQGSFGISIGCSSCHDAATSWASNTPPSVASGHINGTFAVTNYSGFTYPSDKGTCGTNDCHNNGKNAAPSTVGYTWGTPMAGCTGCHGTTTVTLTTQSHDEHLNAAATFGITIACSNCHAAAIDSTHIDQNVTLSGLSYTGDTAITGTTYGSCGTNSCHNDGTGAAPPAYTWGTGAADCSLCHATTPATKDHTLHLSGTTGPNLGTNCGACHEANATNTSMAGKTRHINAQVTFRDAAGSSYYEVATGQIGAAANDGVDTCNNCHGGATPALTAKDNWSTAIGVTCESCHGAYAAANTETTGGGMSAPLRAGSNYSSWGHGRTGSGKPAQNCVNCHNEASAHISGAPNDTNRLDVVSGKDYAADPDGFCGACHETTNVEHVHKANGASGTSDNGDKCYICHEPHGTSGFDAMVRDSIGSKTVAGFTDRTVRTSYYLDPPNAGANVGKYGICQVCHDPTDPTAVSGAISYFNRTVGTPGHYSGNCTGCHKHPDTPAFKPSGCSGCHGDATGGNFWPDSNPDNLYEDRNAAHVKHIDAIYNANSATLPGSTVLEKKNATCSWCHPNPGGVRTGTSEVNHYDDIAPAGTADVHGDARTGATATYFQTIAGVNDTDATFSPAAHTCANLDCHGGQTTRSWYWLADTVAPVFGGGGDPTITVSDAQVGGTLNVSWTAATDAYPSNPVLYDLTWSDVAGNVYSSPLGSFTGLTVNQATVTGLTNSTTYYFGVRAKDSVTPTSNQTTNTNTASGSPSGSPPGQTTTRYYLTKASGTVYGATAENMPACGSTTGSAFAAAGTTSTSVPPGRGLLGTTPACAASVNNYVSNSSPNVGNGTTFESFVGFYMPTVYSTDTTVFGTADNNFGIRGSGGTEDVRIYLVAVNSSGTHTAASSAVNIANVGTSLAAAKTPDLSALSLNVPAGSKVGVVFHWADTSTTVSTNDRITVDNYDAVLLNYITLTEGDPTDSTAPVFSGGSGVAVTDVQADGVLNIQWNTATDISNPVKYDLYWSAVSAADVWNNLLAGDLTVTSYRHSGLTNGASYWYGVRAKDAWDNVTVNVDTASGIPTAPAGSGCTMCHGTPPTSGGGAGSHAKHANSDAVYTECNRCHPGAAVYTNGHQDGKGQLGFAGVAYTATYAGNLVTYKDGSNNTFYSDADGYGVLNDSAGDGVDDGTCFNTGANCHSAGTPQWGVPGSVQCGSCHGTTTPRSGYTDTSSDKQGAPPLDRSGASTGTKVGKHLAHLNVSFGNTNDSCALCHNNAGSGSAFHGDGTVQVSLHSTAGTGAQWMAGTPGSCSSLDPNSCHTGTTWNSTTTLACTDCHSTGFTTHLKTTKGGADVACTQCHPGGSAYPTRHATNGSTRVVLIPNNPTVGIDYGYGGIHLGGDVTDAYALTTEAEICWRCHDQNNNGNLNDAGDISEWGTNTATTNQFAITGITGAASAVVTTATPNTKLVVGESVQFFVGSGMVQLNDQIGKVTAVSGTTFTVNINTTSYSAFAAGNSYWAKAYDYGTLSAPNWVSATWYSSQHGGGTGIFAYKSGAIQSTHTANPQGAPWNGPTAAGADTVAQVRCSYCHDVHNLNKAVSDSQSGKPYLRGTWKGNPYREDGAPRSGMTYVSQGNFGSIPRGGTGAIEYGGYQIDQNNLNPTTTGNAAAHLAATTVATGWSLPNSAGVCTLCHGADVDNLNTFGNASDAWIGTNGHSAAAIGGTGIAAANIFTMSGSSGNIVGRFAAAATAALYNNDGINGGAPRQGYLNAGAVNDTVVTGDATTDYRGGGFRGLDSGEGALLYTPDTNGNNQPYAYNTYNWGAHVDDSAAQTYHKFSCSKCHNPHASRLPRLMITNCLDTKQNTWDTGTGVSRIGTGNTSGGVDAIAVENKGMTFSNSTAAQNCHRLKNPDEGVKATISGITKGATTTVTTSAAHGLAVGDVVRFYITAGMIQLNNWEGTVATVPNTTSFTIAVNSSSFSNFTAGQWARAGSRGTGWNKVTPWTSGVGQDNPGIQ